MSVNPGERHPFLDDLAEDAELTSTLMRRAVIGRENVKKLVTAVGTLYRSQTPLFLGSIENRTLLQYHAEMVNGKSIDGVAVIERDPSGTVQRVSVTFSPLDSALSLAARLAPQVENELGADLFL